ncbi:YhjD/YihY/BrkB family envelope integrity protein [Natronorarus salvus]|uniref:YhjD/YihY/BrkB family envelope integrity protein n=1 Tax=Natronorarus salvus TaxID=3117733 RepID=UPI002F26D2F4
MSASPRELLPLAKAVVTGIKEENVTFMAGSIAYQAFVSLIPLLVLVFFLVSVVGDDGLAATVTATTRGFLPESGNDLLEDAIAGSVATTGASAIGLVTLLWGSLKIFRGLDTAFSEIYDSTAENSFVEQLRDALVVFVAIGLALVAAAVASTAFAFFPDSALLGLVNPLLLAVGLSIAFAPMYYYFPDVDVTVREILPGVVVAAVGWAALQALFQVYVSVAADSESAGAIGAVLLLLTWLYFGGLVLLVGAVVNAANGGRLPAVSDRSESGSEVDTELDGVEEEESRADESARGSLDTGGPTRPTTPTPRELAPAAGPPAAERTRRRELTDRVDRLEMDNARLQAENDRLRRALEGRRGPRWRRLLGWISDRVPVVRTSR